MRACDVCLRVNPDTAVRCDHCGQPLDGALIFDGKAETGGAQSPATAHHRPTAWANPHENRVAAQLSSAGCAVVGLIGLGFFLASPPPEIEEAFDRLERLLVAWNRACAARGVTLIVASHAHRLAQRSGLAMVEHHVEAHADNSMYVTVSDASS